MTSLVLVAWKAALKHSEAVTMQLYLNCSSRCPDCFFDFRCVRFWLDLETMEVTTCHVKRESLAQSDFKRQWLLV